MFVRTLMVSQCFHFGQRSGLFSARGFCLSIRLHYNEHTDYCIGGWYLVHVLPFEVNPEAGNIGKGHLIRTRGMPGVRYNPHLQKMMQETDEATSSFSLKLFIWTPTFNWCHDYT